MDSGRIDADLQSGSNPAKEADMSVKKKHSIEWKIFNAAIKFLQERKLAKNVFGRDKTGQEVDEDQIWKNPKLVVCACALGAVYGGAGIIQASMHEVQYCKRDLEELVQRKTKNPYASVVRYSDRYWIRKGDIIQLLSEARDAHA